MLMWINLSTIYTCSDCLQEPKLTSNTKHDTTACLGTWYTWDRILQTSLKGKTLCRYVTLSLSLYFNPRFIGRDIYFQKKNIYIYIYIYKEKKNIYIYIYNKKNNIIIDYNLGKEFEHDLVTTTIKA